MTAAMFQGEGGYQDVVGQAVKGAFPRPPIQGLSQGSEGPVMSDLQNMMSDEQKRHMDSYIAANGHNDHGMGQ